MVALGANVAVAAAKFVGAALTGSAALFAEGAESVSDTLERFGDAHRAAVGGVDGLEDVRSCEVMALNFERARRANAK